MELSKEAALFYLVKKLGTTNLARLSQCSVLSINHALRGAGVENKRLTDKVNFLYRQERNRITEEAGVEFDRSNYINYIKEGPSLSSNDCEGGAPGGTKLTRGQQKFKSFLGNEDQI